MIPITFSIFTNEELRSNRSQWLLELLSPVPSSQVFETERRGKVPGRLVRRRSRPLVCQEYSLGTQPVCITADKAKQTRTDPRLWYASRLQRP
jgi:hypothetical protein